MCRATVAHKCKEKCDRWGAITPEPTHTTTDDQRLTEEWREMIVADAVRPVALFCLYSQLALTLTMAVEESSVCRFD
jgi:hypothetical protein